MSAHRAKYPVATMCRVLGVSTSGYYSWAKRGPSARVLSDRVLAWKIRAIHLESRGTYGAPRVHVELTERQVRVAKKRVARLMRSEGITGVSRSVKGRPSDHTAGQGIGPHVDMEHIGHVVAVRSGQANGPHPGHAAFPVRYDRPSRTTISQW